MATTETDTRDALDRLIHDAEHAESGAEFARRMGDRPAASRLNAKAERLRAESVAMAGRLGVTLCEHGRPADECTEDPCFEDTYDDD